MRHAVPEPVRSEQDPCPDPAAHADKYPSLLADALEQIAATLRDGETLNLTPLRNLQIWLDENGLPVVVTRVEKDVCWEWANMARRPHGAPNPSGEIEFRGEIGDVLWVVRSTGFDPRQCFAPITEPIPYAMPAPAVA